MNRVAVPLDLPPPSPGGGEVFTLSGPTMGVRWTVKALLPPQVGPARAQGAVQARLNRIVAQMSTWEPDSAVSRFNRARAGTWMALAPEFFTVLEAALDLARDSEGAFDPTAGRLVDLWGFGPAGAAQEPPSPDAVSQALAGSGWRRTALDRAGRRVLQPGGVSLDLSGIAKGFGVDEAARTLEGLGARHYLVEIGGELRGAGTKPDGQPWWVEVEMAQPPLLVALSGLSIASSGDHRRFFEHGGKRYAHTLDPRTGRPVDNGIAGVSVLHPECMWADALCTLLTVLGPEAGMAHAVRTGLAARFVLRTQGGLEERVSPALQAMLD